MSKRLKFFILIFALIVFKANSQGVNYPDSSVLSSGLWYYVTVSSDGIYKLSYNDFINLGVAAEDINFDNLSIFGNGGNAIDEVNANYKFSDLKENAIYVNKSEGYVLFYAKATTKENYNPSTNLFSFTLHPYATETRYFITFDSNIGEKKRIENINIPNNNIIRESNTGLDYVFHKRELVNNLKSGRYWLGENFLPTATNVQIPMSLPNIATNYPADVNIRLMANSSTIITYNIKLNNSQIGTLNISPNPSSQRTQYGTFHDSISINNATNTFDFEFQNANTNSEGWLDYILINYTKNLSFNNNYLKFFSPQISEDSVIRYVVNNVRTNNYMVWDLTDNTNIFAYNTSMDGTNIAFNVLTDTVRSIAIVAGSSFPTPKLGDTILNQNLHGIDTAEFVIIYNAMFENQAKRLAELHRQHDNIMVATVELNQVYNEFSSGTKDFLSIREFIRMMYKKTNGQYPKNVLLFGDGTYDNKNILQYNNNYFPTYQGKTLVRDDSENFTSDDVLASIGDSATNATGDSLYVGIGRIPAGDTTTANIIVDKCERYLTRSDLHSGELGDWRNVALLTSDDYDVSGERYFIDNAETIYKQIDATQPTLNVQKVYEDAYKEYSSSSGATYPDASNAVNERMKNGCLIFNYLGHGSPDHLSSERLISITDITSWDNYNKLCLMITSTCEFNRFDLADKQAAGEYILTSENGAGIALIAAARPIASNNPINKALFKYALERGDNGKALTFGQVMQHAKNDVNFDPDLPYGLSSAERSITLIGDPALRISLPMYNVRTLSINESTFDTINGVFNKIDTIQALSQVTVSGDIVDFNGKKVSDFNGKIQISLYDKKKNYYTLNNSNLIDGQLQFEQQNSLLHKGIAQVVNGEFIYTFTIPKDIAYNYGNGKFSYYAQTDSTDAAGYCKDFIIGGIDSNASDLAISRPEIGLYMNDTNFVSGGICDRNPSLYAVIYDTILINTVGSGLGHDIIARLDNAANTFILNDYYISDNENSNIGYLTYPFSNLSEGVHTLTLKVWNIYNYSSEKTITFRVVNEENGEYEAVNYPNPFRDKTTIELRYNQPKTIQSAKIKIFDERGNVVSEFDISDKIGTYNIGPIEWDAISNGGAKMQNGLYFYIITLHTNSGDEIVRGNKMILLK